jgi:hypothetical protein
MYRVTAKRRDGRLESWAYLDQSRAEYQRDWAEGVPAVFTDVTLLLEELDITHYDVDRITKE